MTASLTVRDGISVCISAMMTGVLSIAALGLANVGTTTAEFAGIAAGFQIFGVSRYISVPIAAALVSFLVLRGGFRGVERVLLALSAVFIAYIAAGFLAHPDWSAAFAGSVVPTMPSGRDEVLIATAVLGTTLAPWGLAFIQSYAVDKRLTPRELPLLRWDVITGAVLTGVIGFFVVIACAATMHAHGLVINDASDAAAALEPLAGRLASELFAAGLIGAALLAASAALHAGAGRVFVGALDERAAALDGSQPELMMRPWPSLKLGSMSVACGCGGGEAVRAALPNVLSTAQALVLDADALNAIAADTQLQTQLRARAQRGRATVITPHPLEAARLLGRGTADVQANRLAAGRELADRFACVAVLKGSGTIVAAHGQPSFVNPTGNARLATPGTGDVLAGLIAARLAHRNDAQQAAADAVFVHGLAANHWPVAETLTAAALARRVGGL